MEFGADGTRQTRYFLFSFRGRILFCQDYSNRVAVLVAQMVAIRFPSASKIWTVPVPVKVSAVVSCNASVASTLAVKIAFRGIGVTHQP